MRGQRWDQFFNVRVHGRLVVFDRQQIVGTVFEHQIAGGVVLGMEGVQTDFASVQVELLKELPRHGDFVGLGVHHGAAQIVLTGHAHGGEYALAAPGLGLFAVQPNPGVKTSWGCDFRPVLTGERRTRDFAANALYLEVIRLAHNLVTTFQQTCLPQEWHDLTLSTLRYKLFWLPGELTRPQNQPTLRLADSPTIRTWTENILARIHKLKPLED